LFGAVVSANTYSDFTFAGGTGDSIRIYKQTSGADTFYLETNAVYRDPNAWYALTLVVDTTQATASNRVKLYVNGVQQTFAGSNYPSQNLDLDINNTVPTYFCRLDGDSPNPDGYMAEVNFIDGQALTPSSFGAFDATTGVWQPVRYTGTYGTNGFYLNFSNTASTTTLGADSSGNGNNWTTNNISLTAGSTYDSMTDVPTLTSATAANYAVLNPLDTSSNGTLSRSNLQSTSVGVISGKASIAVSSGKWYWEVTCTGGNFSGVGSHIGIDSVTSPCISSAGTRLGNTTTSYSYNSWNGAKLNNSASTAYGSTYTNGDVISIALDLDSGKIWWAKNGTWQASGNPAAGTNAAYSSIAAGLYTAAVGDDTGGGIVLDFNFGQRPFAYTPPSGFVALNTFNLPTPTVVSGKRQMRAYTYTGNGGGLQVGEVQKPFTTYNLSRSLRFRSSASAYLNRTPASAGNRKTWTWSGWVKRGDLSSEQNLFDSSNGDGTVRCFLRFKSSNVLYFQFDAATPSITTTSVYRDPSAWYHIMIAVDSTQATASNRLKLYVNGVQVTAGTFNYPSLNADSQLNIASQVFNIGRYTNGGEQFDGYMAEVNFIDGQALTPSSFGQTDGNNYWVPKTYSGTYGTNGFYLPFTDNTSTTTLGADSSGNSNNWTLNNISLTAGTTYDSMTDVPTLTSATAANYAVLNPVNATSASGTSLSNGNLQINGIGSGNVNAWIGTLGVSSGKWYYEVVMGENNGVVGISQTGNPNTYPGGDATSYGYSTATKYNNGNATSYGATLSAGDIVGVAYDLDAGTITFYKNGVSQGQAFSGLSGIYFPAVRAGTTGAAVSVNFGQRPFAYTPPTGFVALNSYNIPEDTSDVETPDLVWIKSRSASQNHTLFDSVRGTGLYLGSNTTSTESTDVNSLLQFNKNGFLLGSSSAVNTQGNTYVGWGWKAGGAAVTNTAGSITSQVSANPTAGFSVVTYTGNGIGGATVGHGLNVTPAMIIIKGRNVARTWTVYHKNLTSAAYYIGLETTNPQLVDTTMFNSTAPTSSVFSVGTYNSVSANTYVAYCWTEVPGYSAFGSYTANASTDGPLIYCGFKPRFIMLKRSSAAGAPWTMIDTTRNPYNTAALELDANTSGNEYSVGNGMDVLSNGFKLRDSTYFNTSNGDTFIWAAFAETPFRNALAR
jgi:hypothetical protein